MRFLALVVTLAALSAGCSMAGETSAGREDAGRACSLLDRAIERASARVDRANEDGDELVHPSHLGDDGYEAEEWQMFGRAADLASRSAKANRGFAPLSSALSRLLGAKGSGGIAAVFTLNEPIQDALDECYESRLLPRPR